MTSERVIKQLVSPLGWLIKVFDVATAAAAAAPAVAAGRVYAFLVELKRGITR